MEHTIKLTIVYDNYQIMEGLQTDWGFSCLIESARKKVLFDTGDNGTLLLANMAKLGIDPGGIDTIFLSHFHHDHTGGLHDFLLKNPGVKVLYPASFPEEIVDMILKSGAEAFPVSGFSEILPDFYTLGEIQGSIPEQSMVVRLQNGIVIITGCTHPGVINIVKKASDKFPHEKILYLLGGFHLHKTNEEDIKEIIKSISDLNVVSISPAHCSGERAKRLFKETFKTAFIDTGVGKEIKIDPEFCSRF